MQPKQIALMVAHPSRSFLRHPHEAEKRTDLTSAMAEVVRFWRREERPILHFLSGGLKQTKPEIGLEPNRREFVYTELSRVIETAPNRDEQRIQVLQVIGALRSKDLAYLAGRLVPCGIQVRASTQGFRIDDSNILTLRQEKNGD